MSSNLDRALTYASAIERIVANAYKDKRGRTIAALADMHDGATGLTELERAQVLQFVAERHGLADVIATSDDADDEAEDGRG